MRASSTDRTIACPASLVEQSRLVRREASDLAAGYGTLAHHWKQHGNTELDGASDTDRDFVERKILLSGIKRDVLWTGGAHEVTFALGLDGSGPYLHNDTVEKYSGLTADAWKKKDEFSGPWLTGTIDYLADGWIDDLKCGKWPVDPRTSGQLKSYALFMWFTDRQPFSWDIEVSITHWPKYPIGKKPARTYTTLTGLDMEQHLEALNHAYYHPDEYNPGYRFSYDPDDESPEPCTFCDSREPFPASEWMQHYIHRALPACAKGLAANAKNQGK